MVQFGGHHLGLNLVIAGGHGVITPTLTCAQPAVYPANGRTVRALAQKNDKAFALSNALDEAQRKEAMLNYEVGNLVLGLGHEGSRGCGCRHRCAADNQCKFPGTVASFFEIDSGRPGHKLSFSVTASPKSRS